MDEKYNMLNIKEILKSFKYWPRIFKLLWGVDYKNLIILTMLNIINGILPTVSILLMQNLINSIQTSTLKSFKYIFIPFVLYAIVSIITSIVGQFISYIGSVFQLKLPYKLGIDVLEKAKKLNLSDFENSEIYDKLRRAQNEANGRTFTIFSLILNFISQMITLISAAMILIIWKPWIIILVVAVPIVSSIYMIKIGYIQYKIHWKRADKERKSWYVSYILTNDIAFKEIKLYKLANHFIGIYKKLNKEFINQDMKINLKRTKIGFFFSLLDELVGAIVCLLVIKAAYLGQILLGNTIAYIRCVSNVQAYTSSVLNTISSMSQNNLYVSQLFDFLDLNVKENDNSSTLMNINEIHRIELKNVYFKYPNRKEYTLKNINFKIEKGENVALIGQNGSGKTTLVKLISGFYDSYEGEILINGISMREINIESFREKIGIMFQDYNKYELTCRENIILGNLQLKNDSVKLHDAICKASADKIIEELPNHIDTQLGVWFNDGIQLSGGQWQKIALSRAFIRDADCYIFDEPSSSLDPVSEYEILEKSSELTKDRIGIFVTHRLINVKRISSRVVVLCNGKIVEEGTHEQLIIRGNHYKYLYKLQNKEEFIDNEINEEDNNVINR